MLRVKRQKQINVSNRQGCGPASLNIDQAQNTRANVHMSTCIANAQTKIDVFKPA